MEKKILPTTSLLVAILLCIGLHILVPLLYFIPSPWNLVGMLPIVFGIWINLSADRAFKKAHTTVKPFEESNALIQRGVFQLRRNPMYLGFEFILIGLVLLIRSLSPYLVVLLFPIVIDRYFIQVEERMLDTKFGEDWRQYKAKVRKWI
jgi:protein-S-isoprenylcysteine O-methyltransferase Ste14